MGCLRFFVFYQGRHFWIVRFKSSLRNFESKVVSFWHEVRRKVRSRAKSLAQKWGKNSRTDWKHLARATKWIWFIPRLSMQIKHILWHFSLQNATRSQFCQHANVFGCSGDSTFSDKKLTRVLFSKNLDLRAIRFIIWLWSSSFNAFVNVICIKMKFSHDLTCDVYSRVLFSIEYTVKVEVVEFNCLERKNMLH